MKTYYTVLAGSEFAEGLFKNREEADYHRARLICKEYNRPFSQECFVNHYHEIWELDTEGYFSIIEINTKEAL